MIGYRTRSILRDYAMQERRLFIRQPIWTRVRRFLRRWTFGLL